MIQVKPKAKLTPRVQVLYRIIKELVEAFDSAQNLDIIKKGILERQYFDKLYIFFLNKAGNKVSEAIITIDWNKHSISANILNDMIFDSDPTKSMTDQLSAVFSHITNYMRDIKQHLHVHNNEMWFGWREEIWKDKEKLKEARQYCGFAQENTRIQPEWEKLDATKIQYDFTPMMLDEFKLQITHFR